VLKPGKKTIVIRVLNNRGKGGFVPDKPYYLSAGEQTVDLKGTWAYKVGTAYEDRGTADVRILPQYQPTALFNAMIAPVAKYAIKGILWYQGESNISLGEEYRRFQSALIADWRNQWGLGPIPFLYVQLPNYLDATYLPSESQWALVREAQLQTLSVPNTAMAVTIDLGEWNDIHPDNKKDVGDRLALAAMRTAYGDEHLVHSGPLYHSHKIVGNTIVINFTHTAGGLVAGNGEPLTRFAIAGADKRFVWGHATIENSTVVVSSDEIPDPVYVRYAWADNPVGANLYNKEGLPASPFRTDP
jgi:sialate O-acetylesterase